MVKLNRIYTRTGDDGTTGLVGGKRIKKNSSRVAAFGDVDELNAVLGVAKCLAKKASRLEIEEKLAALQNELFDAGSELATAPGDEWSGMLLLGDDHTARLERWIDECTSAVPELKSFVLPGGTELSAALHVARTVCRRAERTILTLAEQSPVRDALLRYFNRLSDFLFAASRAENIAAGEPEPLWSPGGAKKP